MSRNVNNAPLSPFTQVPGWETLAEQELMIKYAQHVRPDTNILEIGSENGMSASIWRKYAPKSARLVCIEPNIDAAFQENLKGVNLLFNLIWVKKGSHETHWSEIAKEFSFPEDIDLLFIDGDHSYNGVKTDLMRYTRFVRRECVVLLHDVAWETNITPHEVHLDVRRAVDDWLSTKIGQQFKFVEAADSLVVFRRKAVTLETS